MDILTRSIRNSQAVFDTSCDAAMQHKALGGLGNQMIPSSAGAFSGLQDRARYKQRYGLFRGWLYSAINVIASEAGDQPIFVGRLAGTRPKNQGREQRLSTKAFLRRKMTPAARVKTADSELELVQDHWIGDLLDNPNDIQDRWQFVYTFVANLCLTGWAYLVAGKKKGGGMEIYCLPTTWITPIHDPSPFSRFKIQNPNKAGVEPEELDRKQVAFAHLPNPSDPLSALAPASSQMLSIRIDDHIQTSQERFFENGIFPSVVVTMGKMPFHNTEGRPVMSSPQRRQIRASIMKAMGGVGNYGTPAIIDGLIERIDRLSATQNEMGWEKSEGKVRTRILSAFGVHPYILGEPVGVGGYAQAVNIEKRFYRRVNTFLDMLGNVLTNFLGGFEQDDRIVVWWEQKEAVDPSLRQNLLIQMRRGGDITQNEIRAEAGFSPDEDMNEAVIHPGIAQSVNQVVNMLGDEKVQPEQAQSILVAYGLPEDQAKAIAGVGSTLLLKPKPKPSEREEELSEEIDELGEAVKELKESNDLLRASLKTPEEIADNLIAKSR